MCMSQRCKSLRKSIIKMKYAEHFVKNTDIAVEDLDQESKIGGVWANFSKHFGLKRIGVHHFVIPSGFRTTRPHAESLEEEFVFVINGEIDLWFNGRIKKMATGDCIGFPPGTGIGHTFINNSNGPVELFVAGDRSMKDNQYRWWDDMPEQVLGGHDGMPGPYDLSFIDDNIKVMNAFVGIPTASFSYPGDTETFSEGQCLSRKFELQRIALWIEKIPPGKRTSWPHAHSVEEEFVFTLSGDISVWLNAEVRRVSPMTAIDFKAGSGVAHTLMNETNDDVYYLCVGEGKVINDKIFYPLHPHRNEQVKKDGYLWEDCPSFNRPG